MSCARSVAASEKLALSDSSMPGHFQDFNELLMLGYFEGSKISVSAPTFELIQNG